MPSEITPSITSTESASSSQTTTTIPTMPVEPARKKTPREEYYNLTGISSIFAILAGVFTIVGIYILYSEVDYKSKIVGGDAYNILIYQVRGAAWICVGVCNAVIALMFAVFANAKYSRIPIEPQKTVEIQKPIEVQNTSENQ